LVRFAATWSGDIDAWAHDQVGRGSYARFAPLLRSRRHTPTRRSCPQRQGHESRRDATLDSIGRAESLRLVAQPRPARPTNALGRAAAEPTQDPLLTAIDPVERLSASWIDHVVDGPAQAVGGEFTVSESDCELGVLAVDGEERLEWTPEGGHLDRLVDEGGADLEGCGLEREPLILRPVSIHAGLSSRSATKTAIPPERRMYSASRPAWVDARTMMGASSLPSQVGRDRLPGQRPASRRQRLQRHVDQLPHATTGVLLSRARSSETHGAARSVDASDVSSAVSAGDTVHTGVPRMA
jgi:hypothetical protein